MSQEFTAIADRIKAKGKELGVSNDDALKLYGLFKQAQEGDNKNEQPSFYQLEAKAKWNAWNAKKGTPKEQAEKEYIALAKQLLK